MVLVNDGSTLGVTPGGIEQLRAAFPDLLYHTYKTNKGKGYALREGISASTAPYAITTDIDFPYTQDSMLRLANTLIQKGGLVLGHRQRNYYHKVPIFRKLLSISFRLALKILLKLNVGDTQCGLKGFDAEAKALFHKTTVNGYLYDLELVTLAAKNKVKTTRVPVTLKDGIEFTNMKPGILFKEMRNFIQILKHR